MYQTLEIERTGKVATLWMNRPAVFNAFDEQLIAELTLACRELDADADVRVVILGGRGKHFSAGADLNWMKRASQFTHEQNVEDARNGVAQYVIDKYGDQIIIELKWGQGAKCIGGEIEVKDLEYAQFLQKRGYFVDPDPSLPEWDCPHRLLFLKSSAWC